MIDIFMDHVAVCTTMDKPMCWFYEVIIPYQKLGFTYWV